MNFGAMQEKKAENLDFSALEARGVVFLPCDADKRPLSKFAHFNARLGPDGTVEPGALPDLAFRRRTDVLIRQGANTALLLGPTITTAHGLRRLVVFDHDSDAPESRAWVEERFGPAVYTRRTGRGLHDYRLVSADTLVPTVHHVDGLALDIKASHGYVLYAGVHKSGAHYGAGAEPLSAVLDQLPVLTAEQVAVLGATRRQQVDHRPVPTAMLGHEKLNAIVLSDPLVHLVATTLAPRDLWVTAITAIAALYGEEGRALAHEISQHDPRYRAAETDRLYNDRLRYISFGCAPRNYPPDLQIATGYTNPVRRATALLYRELPDIALVSLQERADTAASQVGAGETPHDHVFETVELGTCAPFVPPDDWDPDAEVLLLCGETGAGKTQAAVQLAELASSVLVIAPRCSLVRQLAQRFDAADYQDPGVALETAPPRRLAITVQSLHRLNPASRWGLVVIDESELTFRDAANSRFSEQSLEALIRITSGAQAIVVADATAGPNTTMGLLLLAPSRPRHRKVLFRNMWTQRRIYLEHKPQAEQQFLRSVANAQPSWCFVPGNLEAQAIGAAADAIAPGSTLVVTGETRPDLLDLFADPDAYLARHPAIRHVVYNSAFGVGVSVQDTRFTRGFVIGSGCDGVGSATLYQAAGRFRATEDVTLYVAEQGPTGVYRGLEPYRRDNPVMGLTQHVEAMFTVFDFHDRAQLGVKTVAHFRANLEEVRVDPARRTAGEVAALAPFRREVKQARVRRIVAAPVLDLPPALAVSALQGRQTKGEAGLSAAVKRAQVLHHFGEVTDESVAYWLAGGLERLRRSSYFTITARNSDVPAVQAAWRGVLDRQDKVEGGRRGQEGGRMRAVHLQEGLFRELGIDQDVLDGRRDHVCTREQIEAAREGLKRQHAATTTRKLFRIDPHSNAPSLQVVRAVLVQLGVAATTFRSRKRAANGPENQRVIVIKAQAQAQLCRWRDFVIATLHEMGQLWATEAKWGCNSLGGPSQLPPDRPNSVSRGPTPVFVGGLG